MKNAKTGYRIFLVTVFLVAALESSGVLDDPLVQLGFDFESDLTAVIHTHIIFSVFEICIVLALLLWFLRSRAAKRKSGLEPGSLIVPLLVFTALLLFGVLYGLAQPVSNLTEALWEVRGFLMMIAGYFLIGMYIRDDVHANRLVWMLLAAATVLALNNIWIPIGYPAAVSGNDLAFDHTDSVVLGLAMILCITIITYGGTRNQRRFAMAVLPVLMISLLIMKRRAAFPVLGIGIIVVVIFLLRLRPRLFWKYVPPLALLCTLYLVVFWNNTGTLGQPARAVSSQFNPDPRDYASNLYRDVEKVNIQANIFTAPLTGLGFGQAYYFYYPMVTDLSATWPFFHYETHNAILWIWMKDGAIGFIAFWWLLGRGVYDGSRVVETQREEWALVEAIRRRFSKRRGRERLALEQATGLDHILYQPAPDTTKMRRSKTQKSGAPKLNVPHWERSDEKKSVTAQRSATLALLVAAICMIPMQVVYSYVDLGIVNERDMLIFGLMLGIIARGYSLLGVQPVGKKTEPSATLHPSLPISVMEDTGVSPGKHRTGSRNSGRPLIETRRSRLPLLGRSDVPQTWEPSPETGTPGASQSEGDVRAADEPPARRAVIRQARPDAASSRGPKWQTAVRSTEASGDTPTADYEELLPWELPETTPD